jgi:cobaltochelatase CobS
MVAFQAFMSAVAPKVDANQVHSIVDERLKGLVLPMRLEVTRNGETKPVEGLAHKMLPAVIKILSVRKHVMMVGPAGTGKSHIGHQAADALGLPFYAISVGPTMTESRIIGYKDATGNYQATLFRDAYENGGVFLFDEVDNGSASVLIVINAALANGMMAFPDGMVKRHPDFVVIAAANTYGIGPDRAYVGRQALDAAFRNRFIYVPIGVDEPLEEALCMASGLDTGRIKSVLAYCRHLRRNVERFKLPVVVGPRNSEAACTLLATGFTARDTIEYAIRCGMSDTDWSKVADGAPSI